MAREKSEPRKRVVGYLDPALYPEWQEITERRGGESAAVGWVIYEEILRKRGAETKDDMLHKLLAEQEQMRREQEQMRRKVEMTLLLVWRMVRGGKVEITADDVRTLKQLLAEIDL